MQKQSVALQKLEDHVESFHFPCDSAWNSMNTLLLSIQKQLVCLYQNIIFIIKRINYSNVMSSEDDFLSAAKSRTYFNAIDKAHELLEHHRDLGKKVPSCVVVGMQSAGKSAVLSRISGISFPQDSEVCTRVAIELRLRRGTNPEETRSNIIIKAGNSEGIEVDKSNSEATENALRSAQATVLNGRLFEDKISVKVEKEGKDLPEVTLIDLPGVFFAKDEGADELEGQVKKMIDDRVHNDMALILHVVPLNQDSDTLSTWRIVHEADKEQKRTIPILTKADLAIKDGEEILKKRIQKVLDDSQSSKCFIVHGAAKDSEEEAGQLNMVTNYIEELGLQNIVKVGVESLNAFIEDRMLQHIKEKVPEMRRLLEKELNNYNTDLKVLGRQPKSSLEIALHNSRRMTDYLDTAYSKVFKSKFRRLTEDMAKEVFEIDIEPLGLVDRDKADDDLKKQYDSSDVSALKPHLFKQHLLALEIKKMDEDDRPMVNEQYTGTIEELENFLNAFANPLDMIVKKFANDVFSTFQRDAFDQALEEGTNESTKIAIEYTKKFIEEDVIYAAKDTSICFANFLVDSVTTNTLTTNKHYLTETSQKMKTQFESDFENMTSPYKADMTPFFHTLCDLNAFLKTRKKMLPDSIQTYFSKVLKDVYKEARKQIDNKMMSDECRDMIKESDKTAARRVFLLERELKVKAALQEISHLY